MIEEYKFGSITVGGKTYNQDIGVCWDDEVFGWQRKDSHLIDAKDVTDAVNKNPDTIVIGIGEAGRAEVSESAKTFIREKGIKLVIDKTEEAAKTFNVIKEASIEEEGEQEKVVGLFHLTC